MGSLSLKIWIYHVKNLKKKNLTIAMHLDIK